MPSVRFSPVSLHKLDAIQAYIADELKAPQAAASTISKIFESLRILESNPGAGPRMSSRIDNVPERFADTRFLVCGNYLAIYEYAGDIIEVLNIYHGREDLFRRFLEEID